MGKWIGKGGAIVGLTVALLLGASSGVADAWKFNRYERCQGDYVRLCTTTYDDLHVGLAVAAAYKTRLAYDHRDYWYVRNTTLRHRVGDDYTVVDTSYFSLAWTNKTPVHKSKAKYRCAGMKHDSQAWREGKRVDRNGRVKRYASWVYGKDNSC